MDVEANLRELPVFAASLREAVETLRADPEPLSREAEVELYDMVILAANLLDEVATELLGRRKTDG